MIWQFQIYTIGDMYRFNLWNTEKTSQKFSRSDIHWGRDLDSVLFFIDINTSTVLCNMNLAVCGLKVVSSTFKGRKSLNFDNLSKDKLNFLFLKSWFGDDHVVIRACSSCKLEISAKRWHMPLFSVSQTCLHIGVTLCTPAWNLI